MKCLELCALCVCDHIQWCVKCGILNNFKPEGYWTDIFPILKLKRNALFFHITLQSIFSLSFSLSLSINFLVYFEAERENRKNQFPFSFRFAGFCGSHWSDMCILVPSKRLHRHSIEMLSVTKYKGIRNCVRLLTCITVTEREKEWNKKNRHWFLKNRWAKRKMVQRKSQYHCVCQKCCVLHATNAMHCWCKRKTSSSPLSEANFCDNAQNMRSNEVWNGGLCWFCTQIKLKLCARDAI